DGAIKLHVNGKEVSGISDCPPRKGYLALQSEGAECHFKNIRIKELPPFPQPEVGFVPLFNGKDLDGWEVVETLKAPHRPLDRARGWVVEGNVLRCVTDEFLWLRHRREYKDFVLRLEFQLARGAQSGVYVRQSGAEGLDGRFVPIIDEANSKVPADWRTGAIWNVVAPKGTGPRPPGEWNDLEIRCEGRRVKVSLN